MANVASRCPTFHWTSGEGGSIELVIYRVSSDASAAPPTRILTIQLPGTSQGWTPSLEQCLEPGQDYAWSLRSIAESVAGDWSEARLFRVAAHPAADVEAAAELLRQYLERSGTQSGEATPSDSPAPPSARPRAPGLEAATTRQPRSQPSVEASRPEVPAPGERPQQATPSGAPQTALTIDDSLNITDGGSIFLEDELFAWDNSGTTDSIGIGRVGLSSSSTGDRNTAVGVGAQAFGSTGDYNTALGSFSLYSNQTGIENTAAGTFAARLTTGDLNTALGAFALFSNTTSSGSTAVGSRALEYNTAGANTAVGARSLRFNVLGFNNTAVGYAALASNTGSSNTALGSGALFANGSADNNTGLGQGALTNSTGNSNTGVGAQALDANTSGAANTAMGVNALGASYDGNSNVAIGVSALAASFSGHQNVAVGADALRLATGDDNIALGFEAGMNNTNGSDNIYIGSRSPGDESGTIRIGTVDQTTTFIRGISGVTTAGGVAVLVNASHKLGTVMSSRRYKEEIRGMDEASAGLRQLRPVTFRYREEVAGDGPRAREFGLIAEEVAKVYPDLVAYDENGEPYSVRYHVLAPMLLNEVQKQQRQLKLQGWLLGSMLVFGIGLGVGRWRHVLAP